MVIGNVPRIRDVEAMLALLADLGVTVEWTGANEVKLTASAVDADHTTLDVDLAEAIRASSCLPGRCSPGSARRSCLRPAAT